MKEKAIRVDIFENKAIGNCSNNGISSRYNSILLVCGEGNCDIDTDNYPENACKVVKKYVFGKEYMHIEPI